VSTSSIYDVEYDEGLDITKSVEFFVSGYRFTLHLVNVGDETSTGVDFKLDWFSLDGVPDHIITGMNYLTTVAPSIIQEGSDYDSMKDLLFEKFEFDPEFYAPVKLYQVTGVTAPEFIRALIKAYYSLIELNGHSTLVYRGFSDAKKRLLEEWYVNNDKIEWAYNNRYVNMVPFIAMYGKSVDELKEDLGKLTFYKLNNKSVISTSNIARLCREYGDDHPIHILVDVPSWAIDCKHVRRMIVHTLKLEGATRGYDCFLWTALKILNHYPFFKDNRYKSAHRAPRIRIRRNKLIDTLKKMDIIVKRKKLIRENVELSGYKLTDEDMYYMDDNLMFEIFTMEELDEIRLYLHRLNRSLPKVEKEYVPKPKQKVDKYETKY